MAKKYIDAEAYIKYCDEHWITLNVDAVNTQPAADVVEVKRTVWVGIDDYPHDTWECANCGRIIEGDREAFCPSCGARWI